MSELMLGGFNLMLLGMGTVFVFLTILVIGTSLMSRIIMRWHTAPEPEPRRGGRRTARDGDLAEVAAVAAAVKAVHSH